MAVLAGWENFYVIIGSSAGALIGLQFVVLTLIADTPIAGSLREASAAYATPTIVHFGVALLLSAMLSAPWQRVFSAAILWGVLGLIGIVYEIIVARRMQVQTAYTPEFEDWLFHVLLPFAAYATLAGSTYAARSNVGRALFGVAAATLLLLFVGIHNARDAVTYHVFVKRGREKNERPR